MQSIVSAGAIRRELIELCGDGRVDAAHARLLASGLEAEHHPNLWELLERHAIEAGHAALAHRLRQDLLAADVACTEIILNEARHDLEQGQPAAARAYLERSFGTTPSFAEARILLGAALAPEDPDHALMLLSDAERATEADMLLAIDALRGLGALRQAIDLCRHGQARYPQNGAFSNRLGWLAEGIRDFEVAIAVAKTQLDGDADSAAQALNRLVRLHLRLGDRAAALQYAADLLSRDTGPLPKLRLARTLRQPGLIKSVVAALPQRVRQGEVALSDAERAASFLIEEGQVGLALFLWRAGVPPRPEDQRLLAQHGFGPEGERGLPKTIAEAATIRSPDLLLPLVPQHGKMTLPAGWRPGLREGDPILLVNSVLAAGGAERQFLMVARALVAAGLSPERIHAALFSIERDRGHDHFEAALRATGVHVHDLSCRPLSHAALSAQDRDSIALLPARLRSDVSALLDLAQSLRPAVIHGWQDRAAIASGLVSQLLDTPRTVLSMRNMRPNKRGETTDWVSRFVYRAILAEPSVRITANASEGARDYEDWLGLEEGSVSILANAVDHDIFAPRAARASDTGPLRILGVFRLTENKRPLLWLETVATLARQHGIQVAPRILGAGPLSEQVREKAQALGLDLQLDPPVDDPSDMYRQSNALLLMSSVEGTPNVILEAQACGLPVAACRVGGVAEALFMGGAGGGLLLDADTTAEAAATRLAEWLPGVRKAPDAPRIAFIQARYSTQALARHLLTLYGAQA